MARSEPPSACSEGFSSIPDVDLRAWRGSRTDREALAEQVRRVCHDVGFFQLVGHGLEPELIEAYFTQIARFFELPEAVKTGIDKARSPHFRGWERVGSELTDNRVDHREQLDLLTEHAAHPPGVGPAYLRIDGPNQWLPEAVLPGFRSTVEAMIARLGALADDVLEVMAVGLGLTADHFGSLFGDRPLSLVKLISYPSTPPGEAGVNAHKDAGFLTLLLQHRVAGLAVLDPGGRWVDVPVRPEVVIVNLGEILQRLTGNYFVATTHRVVAPAPRLSAGYFHGPDLRTRLEPLPLAPEFAATVAASPRHARAGYMATRDELLAGHDGISSDSAATYGEQLWNYYRRSYPDHVRAHHPDLPD